MKKLGLLLLTAAFVLGSGFLKKKEDGSYDADALKKQASEVSAQASAEADKIAKQAGELSDKAIKKAKKAAASMDVKKEEILADLNKSLAEIKEKVSGMDTAKLVATMPVKADSVLFTTSRCISKRSAICGSRKSKSCPVDGSCASSRPASSNVSRSTATQ